MGTFSLAFRGRATENLPYNARPAAVKAALEKLDSIGEVAVWYTRTDNPVTGPVACTPTGENGIVIKFLTEFGPLPPLSVQFDIGRDFKAPSAMQVRLRARACECVCA